MSSYSYSDTAVFVQVGESKSFARAAEELALTPSAVSKAVSRLERRLGARLIVRSTRSLRITELGAEYFERCRDAFRQIKHADSHIADASLQGTGRLTLEVPTDIGRQVVLPAMAAFLASRPHLQLQLVFSERPSDLFKGRVDAAIRLGRLPPSELIASRVGALQHYTCVSPTFLAHHQAPGTPAHLNPEHCLALIDPNSIRAKPWTFRREGVDSTVVPEGRLALWDGDAAITAALCGLGYLRAPSLTVQHHINSGALQRVLSEWDGLAEPVYIVYANHRQQSLMIRALTEFLKTILIEGVACPTPAREHPTLRIALR